MRKAKKLLLAIGILAVCGIFVFLIVPSILFASLIPSPDDVPLNKEVATKLVLELDEYGKIRELDDCQRFHKWINGISIRLNEIQTTDRQSRYYKDVLKEFSIEEADFERFRQLLEKTKLRHYLRTESYSLFIVDGFLDSVWGYLYAHSEDEINLDYFKADTYSIRIVEDLGDNWYRFGGT